MANEIKYNDTIWPEGTPIAGERLSTNGSYTGQHKGSVTQDHLGQSAENQPYWVEDNIVRFGTIMGDAIDTNFPTIVEAASNNEGEGQS